MDLMGSEEWILDDKDLEVIDAESEAYYSRKNQVVFSKHPRMNFSLHSKTTSGSRQPAEFHHEKLFHSQLPGNISTCIESSVEVVDEFNNHPEFTAYEGTKRSNEIVSLESDSIYFNERRFLSNKRTCLEKIRMAEECKKPDLSSRNSHVRKTFDHENARNEEKLDISETFEKGKSFEGENTAVLHHSNQTKRGRAIPDWISTDNPDAAKESKCDFPFIEFKGEIVFCSKYEEVEAESKKLYLILKRRLKPHFDAARRSTDAMVSSSPQSSIPSSNLLTGFRQISACNTSSNAKSMDESDHAKSKASIGLDIEWKVSFKKGETQSKTALLQICPNRNVCYLFHLIFSGMTPSLKLLLEDGTISKVGVGINGDALKLFRDFGVCVSGTTELSDLGNTKIKNSNSNSNSNLFTKWSLNDLTKFLFFHQVSKHNQIRLGNWEKKSLTFNQKRYASTDAWLSLCIYESLKLLPDLNLPSEEKENEEEIAMSANKKSEKSFVSKIHEIKFSNEPKSEVWIPEAAEIRHVAPSKREVFKLHQEEGLSIDEIAKRRGIKPSTVESYVIENMEAGFAYAWHKMGVCDEVRELIEIAIADLACRDSNAVNVDEKMDDGHGCKVYESASTSDELKSIDSDGCTNGECVVKENLPSVQDSKMSSSPVLNEKTKIVCGVNEIETLSGLGIVSLGEVEAIAVSCDKSDGMHSSKSQAVSTIHSREGRLRVKEVLQKVQENRGLSYFEVRVVLIHMKRTGKLVFS